MLVSLLTGHLLPLKETGILQRMLQMLQCCVSEESQKLSRLITAKKLCILPSKCNIVMVTWLSQLPLSPDSKNWGILEVEAEEIFRCSKKLRWNLGVVKPFNRDVPTSQKLQGPSGGAGQGQSWLQWQRLCADHVTSSSAELMKLRKLQTCHSPCSKLKAPQRHITVAHKALLMKPFVCHCEEVFLLSTRMFYLLNYL